MDAGDRVVTRSGRFATVTGKPGHTSASGRIKVWIKFDSTGVSNLFDVDALRPIHAVDVVKFLLEDS
jgi:hypothetical protein